MDEVWLVLLGSATTLFGVLLQGRLSNKQQRARLDFDRTQLETQLRFEDQRLTRQFKHDRSLRDLQELRTVLDGALANLDRISTVGIKAKTRLEGLEADFTAEHFREADDFVKRSREQYWELSTDWGRICLRTGQESELAESFHATIQAWRAFVELLGPVGPITDEHRARLTRALAEAGSEAGEFMRRAHGWGASQPPRESPHREAADR